MDRRSMIQEYFVLATNEKGMMSTVYREYAKSGIVVAGVMDLLFSDIITVEKKKITVIKDLPGELAHITSLYTYLKEKPCFFYKLMRDYIISTGSRLKKLTEEIGESLLADHGVIQAEGGLFDNKTIYIPEQHYKEEVIDRIRSVVVKDDEIDSHDTTLLCILKEAKCLNSYLSEYERKQWKAKWKEIRKNPQYKQLAFMINYVSDTSSALILVAIFLFALLK